MTYKLEQFHQNPGPTYPITIEDVKPGTDFITYIPCNKIIYEGSFSSEPFSDQEGRYAALARVLGSTADISLILSEIGVIPAEYGWSRIVTTHP